MKISLVHNGRIIGEILPIAGTLKTNELNGFIIPTEYYFDLRSKINKYHDIFYPLVNKTVIDNILNKILQMKYSKLKEFYDQIYITINGYKVVNRNSEIRIIDNFEKTGLNNPILHIKAWHLKTEVINDDLIIYIIEFKYPSNPSNIIEVRQNGNFMRDY